MLGLLSSKAVTPAGADGLFFGGADFFGKQLAGVLLSSTYAFVFTFVMLSIIDKFCRVKTTEVEETTLDESLHGENAYIT
jgi:Amt family ammonium transporter